ncbi:MAG: mechanosensitive ion channel family protein [Actinomycetota bacterium]
MPILADHVPLDSREWLLSHGLRIVIVLAAGVLLLLLTKLALRRMHRRLEAADSATQELSLQRAATLTQAITYLVRVAVWTLTILVLLGEFDVNLGPLIAGAGIVGLALGFGAQSLVRDFLSGFFILLEDQFGVGDVIEVSVGGQEVSGKVEKVSLRTTDVRAFDGTRHTIPNGNILMVGNRSRGWARVIVDVSVAYTEDIDRVRGVLEELFQELREEPDLQGSFFSGPEVLGVEGVGEKDVVLRVTAEVRPTRKGSLERMLRQRIKERLDLRGISVPARA